MTTLAQSGFKHGFRLIEADGQRFGSGSCDWHDDLQYKVEYDGVQYTLRVVNPHTGEGRTLRAIKTPCVMKRWFEYNGTLVRQVSALW